MTTATSEAGLFPQVVAFHGQELLLVEKDGRQHVAMKPIVEALGLDWDAQRQMIGRDAVLSEAACVIHAVASKDGYQREMLCLPLDYLNGWLFKVNASRYPVERRKAIIAYQKECYPALANYWRKGAAVNPRITAEQIAALEAKTRQLSTALAETQSVLEDEQRYCDAVEDELDAWQAVVKCGEISRATGRRRLIKRRGTWAARPRKAINPFDAYLPGFATTTTTTNNQVQP